MEKPKRKPGRPRKHKVKGGVIPTTPSGPKWKRIRTRPPMYETPEEMAPLIEEFFELPNTIFTTQKLALQLGFAYPSTLYSYKKKPGFEYLIQTALLRCADHVIDRSLEGKYNSTVAKVLLSANHGINERKEVEEKKVSEFTSLTDADLDAQIRALKAKGLVD